MTGGIIEFSEWQKIDLRVAEIKKVEDIKETDKLIFDVSSDIEKKVICIFQDV